MLIITPEQAVALGGTEHPKLIERDGSYWWLSSRTHWCLDPAPDWTMIGGRPIHKRDLAERSYLVIHCDCLGAGISTMTMGLTALDNYLHTHVVDLVPGEHYANTDVAVVRIR